MRNQSISLLAASLLTSSLGLAQTFNIDIQDPANSATLPACSWPACAPQAGSWNSLSQIQNATGAPLLDLEGRVTSVMSSFQPNAGNTVFTGLVHNCIALGTEENRLMMDGVSGTTIDFDVDGLIPGEYDIVVYTRTTGSGQGGIGDVRVEVIYDTQSSVQNTGLTNCGFPPPAFCGIGAQSTHPMTVTGDKTLSISVSTPMGQSYPVGLSGVQILYKGSAQPIGSSYCLTSTNSVTWNTIAPGALIGAYVSAPNYGCGNNDGVQANDDLVLRAFNMPANQACVFFFGDTSQIIPYGNGFSCVAAPVHRFAPMFTDAAGIASQSVDFTTYPGNAMGIGSSVYAQCWYRDPAAGGAAFNLTDGREFVIQ